jgi:hypothetical protein
MADASLYYRTAGGALASRTVTGDHAEAPPLPEGATALTEAEYADAQEQRQAHTQQLTQETEANQQADYEALRALGVPEATTRRLTGYMGPDSGA